jgi:hypothetical protein
MARKNRSYSPHVPKSPRAVKPVYKKTEATSDVKKATSGFDVKADIKMPTPIRAAPSKSRPR